jgi:hypothetical protein
MYLNGASLAVAVPSHLDRSSRIALNLTPRVPMPDSFNTRHLGQFPRTAYIAQDQADLEMMLGGAPVVGDPDYPGSFSHPYLRCDKTFMYLNPRVWIDDMTAFDFAFGSRIHGNVAAILAGTPAHVIAHDSRTRELAEYYEIPFTLSSDLTDETSARTLFEGSDWGPMVANHTDRFERFLAYLGSHELPHVHAQPDEPTEFDRRVAESRVGKEAKVGVRSTHPSHLVARSWVSSSYTNEELDRLSRSAARTEAELRKVASRAPQDAMGGPDLAALGDGVAALRAENRALRAEVASLREEVDARRDNGRRSGLFGRRHG